MTKEQIQAYIEAKEKEKRTHLLVGQYIEKLNAEVGLSESTMKDVMAKISSKINQCDRSIRDHSRLL